MNNQPLPDTDNPLWTSTDVQQSTSFDALPATLRETLSNRRRGPQKEPLKQQVSVRYSQDVVNKFKATGKGWQIRMDKALQEWLKEHDPHDINV
jgi:uncharacterized protein (DUF4415 family)